MQYLQSDPSTLMSIRRVRKRSLRAIFRTSELWCLFINRFGFEKHKKCDRIRNKHQKICILSMRFGVVSSKVSCNSVLRRSFCFNEPFRKGGMWYLEQCSLEERTFPSRWPDLSQQQTAIHERTSVSLCTSAYLLRITYSLPIIMADSLFIS